MKRMRLDNLSDDELVHRFAEAAKERGAAALDSEVRLANRMFYYMRNIDSELRSRGLESRRKLVSLLGSKDRFVRYYAAQHILALDPKQAREVIEWNARIGLMRLREMHVVSCDLTIVENTRRIEACPKVPALS
jgi:hypothetical protein